MNLLDCRNKIPQTGWFKRQKFSFSQFWRPEVQDQALTELVFRGDGHLLTVCSPDLFVVHVWLGKKEREGGRELVSLLVRTVVLLDQDPPCDLI